MKSSGPQRSRHQSNILLPPWCRVDEIREGVSAGTRIWGLFLDWGVHHLLLLLLTFFLIRWQLAYRDYLGDIFGITIGLMLFRLWERNGNEIGVTVVLLLGLLLSSLGSVWHGVSVWYVAVWFVVVALLSLLQSGAARSYNVLGVYLTTLLLSPGWRAKGAGRGRFIFILSASLAALLLIQLFAVEWNDVVAVSGPLVVWAVGLYQGYRKSGLPSPAAYMKPRIQDLITPCGAAHSEFSVAQISDLHLTGGLATMEGDPCPDPTFRRLVGSSHLADCTTIIATGDITDCGRASEWEVFFSTMSKELLLKTVLVPGNHDVCITSRTKSKCEDIHGISRSLRLVRMISALVLTQGPRAFFVDAKERIRRLDEFIAGYAPRLNELILNPPRLMDSKTRWGLLTDSDLPPAALQVLRDVELVNDIWDEIFPMAVEVPGSDVIVYVFNSNRRTYTIVDNAFGSIAFGRTNNIQARFSKLHAHFCKRHAIFAVHHHLVRPNLPGLLSGELRHLFKRVWKQIQSRGMALLDGPHLYEMVRSTGAKTALFHGHHHIPYTGLVDTSTVVVGAASSTLGSAIDKSPKAGFVVHQMTCNDEGISIAASRQVVIEN